MSVGLPPWHMWGNSLTVDSPGLSVQTTQLVRISYGRPERWKFFFSAVELEGSGASNATIDFDLTLGVGRTALQIPSFEHYVLSGAAPGTLVYSDQVRGPLREFAVATSGSTIVDIPGQDIQLQCRVNSDSACKIQVTAFFSPTTHIRPEWFIRHFPGEEHKGQ